MGYLVVIFNHMNWGHVLTMKINLKLLALTLILFIVPPVRADLLAESESHSSRVFLPKGTNRTIPELPHLNNVAQAFLPAL